MLLKPFRFKLLFYSIRLNEDIEENLDQKGSLHTCTSACSKLTDKETRLLKLFKTMVEIAVFSS